MFSLRNKKINFILYTLIWRPVDHSIKFWSFQIQFYCIQSHTWWYAINSHGLTGTKPFINKAIHFLLMHSFMHSGAVTKIDVINSNVHRSEHTPKESSNAYTFVLAFS